MRNELRAYLQARENKCSRVMLGDADVSHNPPLCVLAGWETKQVTSEQKLVMKRRVQKGCFNPVFTIWLQPVMF